LWKYQEGSGAIGCTRRAKHKTDIGDARPIKRNLYTIPHALKQAVNEHIEEMLKKSITEPRMSPSSSSIVLAKKKISHGSI
jgi:hypothetical protein